MNKLKNFSKIILRIFVGFIGLCIFFNMTGLVATESAGAQTVGTAKKICVFYYGNVNSTVKQRLIATAPKFVVLNTPGGSYKGLISSPTRSDIAELKAAGITVLSYISTGNMVHFKYASDSPRNDRAFVRGCIETVAAEGCDGIFFDEGGIGYHPSHADRYLKAPALDLYGNSNSWAGYTIEDYASYTHSLGMMAVLGTDYYEPRYLNPNVFQIFDYVLTDEGYYPRSPSGSEIGNEAKCWVICQDIYDASTAASNTNDALSRGFAAAYQCSDYGVLASYYESYLSRVTYTTTTSTTSTSTPTTTPTTSPTTSPTTTGKTYRLNITVQGQGSTNYGTGTFSIPANQLVSLTANPASGWKFRSWSWPGNSSSYSGWPTNPASWNMVSDISIIAIFDQVSPSSSSTTTSTPPVSSSTTGKTYQLNITVQGQGSTNYGTGTFSIPANQLVSLTANPASGWKFRSWSWPGNSSSYSGWPTNPASWNMVSDISIIAIFDPK